MNSALMNSRMHGESSLFTRAVAASFLLHVAVLWWVQTRPTIGSEANTNPAYSTIEVALTPAAQPLPQRTAVQRENQPREVIDHPVRHLVEPTVTENPDAQVSSAPPAAAVADNTSEQGTTDVSEPAAPGGSAADANARDRYLSSVLAHIESHKFYPQTARRRGLQGNVHVCFTLDATGMVTDLHVTGDNSLFVESAKAAVLNAIPLPKAPSFDGFPLTVRYQMVFKLQ